MSDHNNKKHVVVIGIGSNTEAHKHISAALDILEKNYGLLHCSPVYQSQSYTNLVVSFTTNEDIVSCKKNLLSIEQTQGRKRNHSDVSCDLDLLLYNDDCLSIENIRVPHSDISQCDYVLRPLADLLPNQLHPTLKQSYKQLWQDFDKPTTLEPIEFKWNNTLLSIQPTCLSL